MRREETFETTLGDLIVVLTEETLQMVRDEKASHVVVAYILSDLLNNLGPRSRSWH